MQGEKRRKEKFMGSVQPKGNKKKVELSEREGCDIEGGKGKRSVRLRKHRVPVSG